MAARRGFITIATGKELYFKDALNLLRSYRYYTKKPLPFAIIADEENSYTREFDVVIVSKNAGHNFLDKFLLSEKIPFDETIFIEPDVLVYSDINNFFDFFADSTDFSWFGRYSDPDRKGFGYFERDLLPSDVGDRVKCTIGGHGGLLYLRKTEKAMQVLNTAKELAPRYDEFHFKYFYVPGGERVSDEPLTALSMAINDCLPTETDGFAFSVYTRDLDKLNLNMRKGYAKFRGKKKKVQAIHWASRYTELPLYKREEYFLNCKIGMMRYSVFEHLRYSIDILKYKWFVFSSNLMDRAMQIKYKRKNKQKK